jgi:hypothetical protein
VQTQIGKRRQKRIKMVLPVKIWGRNDVDRPVSELVHTLDITPGGARLGAVHGVWKIGDRLTLQYRQRKIQFKVVWVKPLEGTRESQVGLETLNAGENWGLDLPETDLIDQFRSEARAAAAKAPAKH